MSPGKSSKRFGARYGNRIRKNVDEAEEEHEDFERVAAGIWRNKETGKKVAGGSFEPDTGAQEILDKALESDLEVEFEELKEAKEELEDS